jgi:AcrR family transcriptional regulator
LQAADQVIGEAGYESATMCAIAAHARSSVGSLYQFFPNKDAVVEALRARYAEEYAEHWRRFTPRAASLGAGRLAREMIDFPLQFAERHPAFLPLFDAPRPACASNRHQMIHDLTAILLRARRPDLSPAGARRIASVVHQIVKGLLTLYARSKPDERPAIVEEFKLVLAGYLRARIEH